MCCEHTTAFYNCGNFLLLTMAACFVFTFLLSLLSGHDDILAVPVEESSINPVKTSS